MKYLACCYTEFLRFANRWLCFYIIPPAEVGIVVPLAMPQQNCSRSYCVRCRMEKSACPIRCLERHGKASLQAVLQAWLTVVPAGPENVGCIFMCVCLLTQRWTDRPWSCLGKTQTAPQKAHSCAYRWCIMFFVVLDTLTNLG